MSHRSHRHIGRRLVAVACDLVTDVTGVGRGDPASPNRRLSRAYARVRLSVGGKTWVSLPFSIVAPHGRMWTAMGIGMRFARTREGVDRSTRFPPTAPPRAGASHVDRIQCSRRNVPARYQTDPPQGHAGGMRVIPDQRPSYSKFLAPSSLWLAADRPLPPHGRTGNLDGAEIHAIRRDAKHLDAELDRARFRAMKA